MKSLFEINGSDNATLRQANSPGLANPANPANPATNEPEEQAPTRTSTCCFSRRRRAFLDGNLEAIAWALDTIATSIIYVGSGAFLTTALIKVSSMPLSLVW